MLIQTLLQEPIFFLLWVLAIVFSLTIHEFSHGLMAKIQGDPTAELEGRLSLNPLAHIDWMGFFLLVVAGFGWAKPVPFNPYNLKNKRFGPALVAMAGPLSNILAVVVIGSVLALFYHLTGITDDNLMIMFFVLVIQVNVLLAVFNFIPIPPLDGSKILYAIIGQRRPDIVMFLERYGIWLLLALVFFGGSIIFRIFYFFYELILRLIFF